MNQFENEKKQKNKKTEWYGRSPTCSGFVPLPQRGEIGSALGTDERNRRRRMIDALRQPIDDGFQTQ